MTVRLVHRPTRITAPLPPVATETIAAPPTNPDPAGGSVRLQMLLPVLGALSSVVLIVVLRGNNRLFLIIGGVLLIVALVAGIALALSTRGGAARQRRLQRENYLDYLERLRFDLRARGRAARTAALALDPPPDQLVPLIGDPARLWERRRADRDFLSARVGLGDARRFGLTVPPEQNPVEPYDPILLGQASAVAATLSVVRGVPVLVDLDSVGEVAVVGPRTEVLDLARSLVLQLAALHAPDDLALALAFSPAAAADWRGVDWLPHLLSEDLYDGPVAARRVAPTVAELAAVLGRNLADRAAYAATVRRAGLRPTPNGQRRLVVVVDEYGRPASPLPLPDPGLGARDLQVTVVRLLADRLHEPPEVTTRITVAAGTATLTDARQPQLPARTVTADTTSAGLFEATARALAGLRLSRTEPDAVEGGAPISVRDLLGLGDRRRLSPTTAWSPRSPRDFLRVPIGLDDLGAPVHLDLKESAQLGMGPHGLCVGATGSGKSELLRTLVTALALSHPPEDLSMILVDYKGGAAFAPLAGLPHIAGLIDNLADDPQLTQRARASIAGEVVRRQEILRDAGSSPSITHYRELRRERPGLPPLPHLLVVIDEFGELVTADPEFVDLLITIGRIGRSIGIHLLLSSQRIESGKLRGLDTYLSYRIGLRTFSAAESALVLDRPDAFALPPVPGYGYLKVDTTAYLRFRGGFVSGPAEEDPDPVAGPDGPAEPLLLPTYNTLGRGTDELPGPVALAPPSVGRTLLEEVVDRLAAPDRRVRPVWLPPLPAALPLGALVAAAGRNLCMHRFRAPSTGCNLCPADGSCAKSGSGGLQVPMGLLDQPATQRQDPWRLDLGRAGGHVAVIGAPQSGRTTFLQTLAASAALTHTPRQLNLYGLDLSGGPLPRIAGLPHVGGVATRTQPDRMRRLVEELLGLLAVRERVFAEHGLDSVAMLRTEHAAGRIPELVSADVVLLVDGFGTLRTDFEELEAPVVELLQRGGGFGLHVVLALTRWNELRMAQQPLVGTRVELRLNDPLDSIIGRKPAETIRADQPGRALTDDGQFVQVAQPVAAVGTEVGPALETLGERLRTGWRGPVAPPIRVLPTDLSPGFLDRFLVEPPALPLGLRQDRMDVALLELGVRDQHLLAYGDPGSGKTTLLRGVARGLVEAFAPTEVAIAVLDLRGALAAAVPASHLGGHARTPAEARRLGATIAGELERRSTGGAAAREGEPRIVLLVDDYDMLATADPLRPLLPYLPSARDLGLHVILARPVAGAARAAYDVVLSTLRDTGGTVLVMSGERSEGQIVPSVYAAPLPPGRARVLRRGEREHLVQIAHFPATAAVAA